MTKAVLQWWLWCCLTFVVIIVAGMFGFYGQLFRSDVTYLGFSTIVVYILSTMWVGYQIRRDDPDFRFVSHVAKMMCYVGILGSFIGIVIAVEAIRQHQGLPQDQQLDQFLAGIGTKFYTSIVGIVSFIFLQTQIIIAGDHHG